MNCKYLSKARPRFFSAHMAGFITHPIYPAQELCTLRPYQTSVSYKLSNQPRAYIKLDGQKPDRATQWNRSGILRQCISYMCYFFVSWIEQLHKMKTPIDRRSQLCRNSYDWMNECLSFLPQLSMRLCHTLKCLLRSHPARASTLIGDRTHLDVPCPGKFVCLCRFELDRTN